MVRIKVTSNEPTNIAVNTSLSSCLLRVPHCASMALPNEMPHLAQLQNSLFRRRMKSINSPLSF